ncbi:uncharacterized protein LOC110434556 isoform X2 [Sorghum bicolor]|uniref:uncharacterized protein LOC110434556 isoform X2 n=1 Tax=Sorghum bicolor TaxID=4558 RepID=UPI000B424D67|nr:uncharacterized protein LOC110434556 isoform X2 [Sorghum bicolor]|eukprot:XP_021314488.1 uncharacterized protein LOC110434556 isoform X2 [Sorghum bicolor]
MPRSDTELSLGRPAPPPPRWCRATGELKQGGTATELQLQGMAILRVARRATAEEEDEGASGDGAAAGLSMRRSMEWFLQRRRRRREGRRQRGVVAAVSPSSSSLSCLTDSDSSRI